MTVFNTESQVQSNDPFVSLYPHPFISLTTFRKNGETVPTTVWFAQDEAGRIYVTTQTNTGKLKRIRHTAQVQMTPSDAIGNLLDGQVAVSGYAREVASDEYERAEATLMKKYGEEYTVVMARMNTDQSILRTYIEIVPGSES